MRKPSTSGSRRRPSRAARRPCPRDLRLPLQLEIGELRVARILIHSGPSTTEFAHLALHGKSDGRHHALGLDRLMTPFGDVNAALELDGARPFALRGDAGFAGTVAEQAVRVGRARRRFARGTDRGCRRDPA
ncbi:MAG: hypothetical protein WDN30_12250 [Pararobbsia sp.]